MSAVIVYSHCVEENGKLRVGWNSNPEIGNVQQNDQVQFITRSFMTQKNKNLLVNTIHFDLSAWSYTMSLKMRAYCSIFYQLVCDTDWQKTTITQRSITMILGKHGREKDCSQNWAKSRSIQSGQRSVKGCTESSTILESTEPTKNLTSRTIVT